MKNLNKLNLGIYEKALPKDIDWVERIKLVKECGYDFVEISIDETDERLARLDWTDDEINRIHKALIDTGVRIPSMCFSGHRRFPMGSMDEKIREKAMDLMQQAIIMDHPFINSITKYMEYANIIKSPWLKVYPDVGNLTAWPENDTLKELELGIKNGEITGIHLKDTLAVTDTFEGKFKEVPFGEGCVDFPKVFKKLKELNYKGPFLIEMWTEKSDNPIEEVKKAKQWMLDKMKEGGFI